MPHSAKITQSVEKKFAKKICVFLLLWLTSYFIYAQEAITHPSAPPDSAKKKTEIFFSFDARNSFVANKDVRIGGAKIGLEFRDKYRFGLGIYAMDPPIFSQVLLNKGTASEELYIYRIEFSYFGIFAEYVLFSNRKWEFSAPVIFGIGETRLFRSKDRNAKIWETRPKMGVNLIEASITGHYKIVYWLGVGGGFGYRNASTDFALLKEHFDAPIYIMKIKLFIGDIYRHWKKRKE
ncbi:MAG: hypothetical protein A3H98_08850 [Bacteroidetes bacterium RIFCSPLOWO2_02_FULL_36_8]|nr:MAG: hypothetical protein A3H98_08850 [Bacteroidetes bacterium RIFCSPLOWO2_02_FULL_36_8]OFY69080.1 MAG: hypothetical protein A3G23_05870 [Bacteroidetes bacterium RIFCSPLOWO2_12_FULL_37_12]